MPDKKTSMAGGMRDLDAVRLSMLLVGLFSAAASAEPWDYGVIVELGAIRTDNVFLARDGLEESETVFTVVPEFFLATDGDRLEVDMRYRPEAYFYSDFSDSDDVYHSLDAAATITLVKERLFLYASAVNYQSIISPDGVFPTTNLPISENRVDSRTLEARPYWQQQLGVADLLIEVGYRDVDYDDTSLQYNNEKYGSFSLGTIDRQDGFAWAVDYNYRRMEYEISMPWEYQRASLDLGIWIDGRTRVFAVGGAETAWDNLFDSSMDDEFWEAGVQYKPSPRLDLELAAGNRSYGNSFRGNFSYVLRRGDISLSYNEGPATRGELAFDRRPINQPDNLDNILDRPGTDDRFIQRRVELASNIKLSKSDLNLRVFSEQRDRRTTADGSPLEDEEYSGLALQWSWDVGAKTTLGVLADVSQRDQEDVKEHLMRVRIDLGYEITPRLSAGLAVMNSEQDGRGSNSFDYTENQLILSLRTEF